MLRRLGDTAAHNKQLQRNLITASWTRRRRATSLCSYCALDRAARGR
jgi:hypothetical protein